MTVRQESVNKAASDTLLQQICSFYFANTNRYVRMQNLFPETISQKVARFDLEQDEEYAPSYLHDIANYINTQGGELIVNGRLLMKNHMDDLKVLNLTEKITETDNIDADSDLATVITKVAQSATGKGCSLQDAMTAIIEMNYKVVHAIKSSSWEDLGLQQPMLTLQERCKILELTPKEMKKLALAFMHQTELDDALEVERLEKEQKDKEAALKTT